MKTLRISLSHVIVALSSLTLISCGAVNTQDKKGSVESEKDASVADCTETELDIYSLYGKGKVSQRPTQKYQPIIVEEEIIIEKPVYQKPSQTPHQKNTYVEPMPYQKPHQTPYQNPYRCRRPSKGDVIDVPYQTPHQGKGKDVYTPVNTYEPMPYPGQNPGKNYDDCGKNGYYCENGGPGQWPGQTIKGKGYNRQVVQSCVDSFRSHGMNLKGRWAIDHREIRGVNILSNGVTEDHGFEPSIIIIKDVNVLSTMRYRLLNPHALYCFENVNVLNENRVSSCYQNNVMYGKDVNVFSIADVQKVNCQ